jgi:hypothetical protein
MAGQERRHSRALLALAAGGLLAGCAQTPMGPTVQVMPGPGKTFDAFQSDQASCKSYAVGQVQGQASAANNQAVGAAVVTTVLGAGLGAALGGGQGAATGAATGAGVGTAIGANGSSNAQMSIQAQYDAAFSQCMYSRGEQVPGYAPIAAAPQPGYVSGGPDPSLVRAVQRELIRLDYLHDVADGAMGPKTASAIRNYEQSNGLPVDGSPSGSLLAKLQGTPAGQTAGAPAAGPVAVAPPSNWVAPTTGAPAPAAPAPAAPPPPAPAAGNWVAPAPTQ